MRFCARCGFSLDLMAGMLADSSRQLRRERQEITGVGWLTATLLCLFTFILVFGLVTLPHLVNPVYLIIWLCFMVTSLAMGGVGLAKLGKQVATGTVARTEPLLVERVSVMESTTRGLNTASLAKGRE